MLECRNLIEFGYIPPELPACFTAKSLSSQCLNVLAFIDDLDSGATISIPLSFSGYKSTYSRRKFSIPNPYHYVQAAKAVEDCSNELFGLFNSNRVSLTKPLDKRAVGCSYQKPSKDVSETKERIKQLYRDNAFEVTLDIQSFFGSIYTHTIPWVLHTKATAKRARGNSLCGNILDKKLQAMNDGQTNGILIGNDISRIVSEVILCGADKTIQQKLKNVDYTRYVDDYYFFVKNRMEVDQVISVVQEAISEYELALNASKIRVTESPFVFHNSFVDRLHFFYDSPIDTYVEQMIIEYLRDRDIRILRYGLTVLRDVELSEQEWWKIEPYLMSIWISNPSLANLLLPILCRSKECIHKRYINKSICAILDRCVPLRHDQEVIWALWIAKMLNIKLSQKYWAKVLASENWLGIVIVLDMIEEAGKKNSKAIKGKLDDLRMRLDDFFDASTKVSGMYSEIWLLAYEATRNGWLNLDGARQFSKARTDPFFKELLDKGIVFYDGNPEVSIASDKAKLLGRRRAKVDADNKGDSTNKKPSSTSLLTLSDRIRIANGY